MGTKPIEREHEYWIQLENQIKENVLKISKKLEELTSWSKEKPMIIPQTPLDQNDIRACIGRIKNQNNYLLQVTSGFLLWLDDAASWMNQDIPFRNSLYLSLLSKNNDLSLWMNSNWISWVVSHEIGHLTGGHLSITKDYEWSEFDISENSKSINTKLKVACEYDADIYAATIFFGSMHLVLKNKTFEKIKHNLFFDLGMIFAGLFMALDYLSPEPDTHPKANQRFMVFMLTGLAEYARNTKRDPILEYEAFTNGALKSFALFPDKHGFEYAEKITNFNFEELIDSRQLLIKNGFLTKRLTPRNDDWLNEGVAFLYMPTRETSAWDLNKKPKLL